MNDRYFKEKGFSISTDTAVFDRDYLFAQLKQTYWATDLTREVFDRSVENALCFGIFQGRKQLGFARVITDKATFAYLADVFVDAEFRGQGLGKWLVQTILAHPDLQGLRRLLLVTADAHTLYAQFGFSPVDKPENYMTKRHHRATEEVLL